MPRSTRRPGDGVGAERGEQPGLVALGRLPALQRTHDEGQRGEQHRAADEHDDAEQDRAAQQDGRHDEEAHDGAGHPGGDVVDVADPPEVAGEAGDDLAGRHLPGERRPGSPHRALGDHGGAERRDEPVAHGEPVPPVGRDGADQAQAHDRGGPHQQGLLVVRDEALVDGLADRGRDERDGQHPRHPEEHAPQDGSPLVPSEPPEVAVGVQWRGLVRVDRVGPEVVRHQSSTLGAAAACGRTSFRPGAGLERAGGCPATTSGSPSGGGAADDGVLGVRKVGCELEPGVADGDVARTRRPAGSSRRGRASRGPPPGRWRRPSGGTAARVARPRAARRRRAPGCRAAWRRRRGSA